MANNYGYYINSAVSPFTIQSTVPDIPIKIIQAQSLTFKAEDYEDSLTKTLAKLYSSYMENNVLVNEIDNVIFNNPATVVYWKDGTKTVVKCQDDDKYSKQIGLAMCIIKKVCGNKGNYNDVFEKWCK